MHIPALPPVRIRLLKSSEPVVASEKPIDAASLELGQGQGGNTDVSKQVKQPK